jgi:uncharacterized protein involved in exopolysaccharide biosynthesis
MFMGENAREREENAAQATSFLSGQVKSAKEKLDKENAKLAAFKGQYLGSLPEEEQTNLNLLMASNSQLEANVQALSRAQQSKAFNESLLTQQEAVAAMSGTGQNPEAAEQQLSALQDQLTSLLARYTPQHPDVIRTQNQIEELKTRMREIPSEEQSRESTKRVPAESSQIQQLRAKLRQDELSIADLTKRQGKIQDQIRLLQERLQASPVVEQQLKEITRNYQAALDFYDDLLKKREQSAMVSDLERKQESGRFRVLDPPSLPSKPSFPKRRYFAGGGAGVGLALAFGLMYLIAVTDKSMYTQAEVEFWLKLPVLVSVPKLEMLQNDASELLAEGLSIRS